MTDIYYKILVENTCYVNYNEISSNLSELLKQKISNKIEGKCTEDGYVKTDSINIVKYSEGILKDGSIKFVVQFECMVCNPVSGMKLECIVEQSNNTIGIKAKTTHENSPIIVYIMKDHDNKTDFSDYKPGTIFNAVITGKEFKIDDSYISVVGDIIS